jgi:hypothetical protein
MRGDGFQRGMRGGPHKKGGGLAKSGRVLTSLSDPIGLSQAGGAPRLTKCGQLRPRHDAMEPDAQ